MKRIRLIIGIGLLVLICASLNGCIVTKPYSLSTMENLLIGYWENTQSEYNISAEMKRTIETSIKFSIDKSGNRIFNETITTKYLYLSDISDMPILVRHYDGTWKLENTKLYFIVEGQSSSYNCMFIKDSNTLKIGELIFKRW